MEFKIPKGVDKVPITVRIDETDFNVIEKLSRKSKKSYNYIVNSMIKYAIQNMSMEEIKDTKKKND